MAENGAVTRPSCSRKRQEGGLSLGCELSYLGVMNLLESYMHVLILLSQKEQFKVSFQRAVCMDAETNGVVCEGCVSAK